MQDRQFMNVREDWTLHDTIIINPAISADNKTPGFFLSYAALGLQNDVYFFNTRNRTIGLFWNNQDARDLFPYGFYLDSIGVRFFAPSFSQRIVVGENSGVEKWDENSAHTFVTDVPRHSFGVLQIQQDEHLKANIMMLPSGMGFQGDGYGMAEAMHSGGEGAVAGPVIHKDSFTQGNPDLEYRWIWPIQIEIPRRANVSFKIVFNEYCKYLLSKMNSWYCISEIYKVAPVAQFAAISGIQVTIKGKRLAQQRGEYHA